MTKIRTQQNTLRCNCDHVNCHADRHCRSADAHAVTVRGVTRWLCAPCHATNRANLTPAEHAAVQSIAAERKLLDDAEWYESGQACELASDHYDQREEE